MKIALIGASGNVGSKIANEALNRGHEVTAIVRHPERLASRDRLTAVKGDVNDPASLASLLKGHDGVVSSVKFQELDPQALLQGVRQSGVGRLAVVGGAGSLKTPDGKTLLESPDFPDAYRPEAQAGSDFLELLLGENEIDWTFLSPSAVIAPGERTGRFRLADDDLLVAEDGQSRISQEDYAVAFVDELENPQHSRRRFTVGY